MVNVYDNNNVDTAPTQKQSSPTVISTTSVVVVNGTNAVNGYTKPRNTKSNSASYAVVVSQKASDNSEPTSQPAIINNHKSGAKQQHTIPPKDALRTSTNARHQAKVNAVVQNGVVGSTEPQNTTTNDSKMTNGVVAGLVKLSVKSDVEEDNGLSQTNLYIRGLKETTTDQDLVELCRRYGTIVSTKAITDGTSNRCKGYGFVDFAIGTEAATAVQQLQREGVLAQMARRQAQDPTNLYLANLPPTMDEKKLERTLRPFGSVVSTRVLRNAQAASKGVGFARMDSTAACERAIMALNGRVLTGAFNPLVVKFADTGRRRRSEESVEQQPQQPVVLQPVHWPTFYQPVYSRIISFDPYLIAPTPHLIAPAPAGHQYVAATAAAPFYLPETSYIPETTPLVTYTVPSHS